MVNIDYQIELYFDRGLYPHYCTFNSSNQFILYGNIFKHDKIEKLDGYIWIYSTSDENKKSYFVEQINDYSSKSESELMVTKIIWSCKKLHKIPKNFELI